VHLEYHALVSVTVSAARDSTIFANIGTASRKPTT
jgi:hypothetical protein